jgi:nucleotide-binding universal stress UspA family protein
MTFFRLRVCLDSSRRGPRKDGCIASQSMIETVSVSERVLNASMTSIVHPTDCSNFNTDAFAHALRIAVAAKATIHTVHVRDASEADEPVFPQARRMLAQWGLVDEDATPASIAAKLGTEIANITLNAQRPAEGISDFLKRNRADLVVLATHGHDGVDHWVNGSIAESIFRQSPVPTLFITTGARGFVRQVSGDIRLRRVLVPVDHWPAPARAIDSVRQLCRAVTGRDVSVDLLHVGGQAPAIPDTMRAGHSLPVIIRYGNVVRSILDAAFEFDVDLIAMPTAGHHGVLDALRGSTTERVLRNAPCPVYAVPV